MKKYLSITLSLTCALVLSACGSSSKAPEVSSVPESVVDIPVWYIAPTELYDDIDSEFVENYNSSFEGIYDANDLYGIYEAGGLIVIKDGLMGLMNGEGIETVAPAFGIRELSKVGISAFPFKFWTNNNYNSGYNITTDYHLGEALSDYGQVGGYNGIRFDSEQGVFIDFDGNVYDYTQHIPDIYQYIIVDEVLISHDGYKPLFDLLANPSAETSRSIITFSNDVILMAHNTNEPYYNPVINNAVYYDVELNQIGETYDSGLGFTEEYAAVEKDGKWGYIDKSGNLVVDYLFDKATPVSQGKAWVIYNGLTGRLNLVDLLNEGITITPEVLDTGTSEKEPMIAQGDEPTLPLGSAKVNVDNLNIRTSPSTSAEALSSPAMRGVTETVYEITQAEGYTWYRIGDNQWIADNGEWVTYSPYSESDNGTSETKPSTSGSGTQSTSENSVSFMWGSGNRTRLVTYDYGDDGIVTSYMMLQTDLFNTEDEAVAGKRQFEHEAAVAFDSLDQDAVSYDIMVSDGTVTEISIFLDLTKIDASGITAFGISIPSGNPLNIDDAKASLQAQGYQEFSF